MKMYDETMEILEEAILPSVGKAIKRARTAGQVKKAFKLGALAANDVKAIEKILSTGRIMNMDGAVIKSIDDLAGALKNKKVSAMDLGTIRSGLLKDVTISPNVRSGLIDDLTYQRSVQQTYKNLTDAEMGARLKKLGYDKSTRSEIIASFKKKGIGKNAPVTPPPGTPPPGTPPPVNPAGEAAPKPRASMFKKLVRYGLGASSIFVLLKWSGIAFVGNKGYKWVKDTIANAERKSQGSTQLPTCIYDLLDTPGCVITEELGPADATGPTMVLAMKKTGNREYDRAGGLKFFMDNTLITGDGKHKGTWGCQDEVNSMQESQNLSDIFENLLINEEFENLFEDVNPGRIDRAIQAAVKGLQGDINRKDFNKIHRKIYALQRRKYNGENALVAVRNGYREMTGGDLLNDLQAEYQGLDYRSESKRSEIINILQKRTGSENENPISNLNITWNDGWNPAGGKKLRIGKGSKGNEEIEVDPTADAATDTSGSATTGGATTSGGTKSSYTLKYDFPFVFGDKNDKIKEIQLCLGLERKYQTGNFGPITRDALKRGNYGETITSEIYRSILTRCGQAAQAAEPTAQPSAQETQPQTQAATPQTQAAQPQTQVARPDKVEPIAKASASQIKSPTLSQVNPMKLAPIAQQQMLAKNEPKTNNKPV